MKENKLSTKEFISMTMKYGVAYIAIAIINVISVAILTRLFSVEQYGYISYFFSAASLVSSVLSLGLADGYIRYFYEPPKLLDERNLRINCSVIPCIIYVLTIIIAIFSKGKFTDNILGVSGTIPLVSVLTYGLLLYITRFITIYYRMKMLTKKYTISSIIISFVQKISVILAIVFAETSVNGLSYYSFLGSAIFVFIFCLIHVHDWMQWIRNLKKIVYKSFREVIRFSLLAWPAGLIVYANQFFTKNAIDSTLSKYALGIYSSVSFFNGIIGTIQGAFNSYWSPFVYKYYKSEQNKIYQVHDLIMFSISVALSLIVIFRNLLFLILGQDFRDGINILILVILYNAYAFATETTSYGINIGKKPQIGSIISFITILLNVGLIYLLVPDMGMPGVGVASAIAGLFYFISRSITGQKYYKMIRKPIKTYFVSVSWIIIGLLNCYIYNSVILNLSMFIYICLNVIAYKNILINVKNTIKNNS